MRKIVNHLENFTINNVSKKLNKINFKVSLSHYQFEKQFVKIFPDGSIQGGYSKMITSLIDFSFIRSLVG